MWMCHVAPVGFNWFVLLTEKSKLQIEDELKSDLKDIFCDPESGDSDNQLVEALVTYIIHQHL